MLNGLPFVGWAIDLFVKISLSVPFYIIWTGFGIGRRFFYFLPDTYLEPEFWNCVGVFIVVPILKGIFVPHIVTVSQNNSTKD